MRFSKFLASLALCVIVPVALFGQSTSLDNQGSGTGASTTRSTSLPTTSVSAVADSSRVALAMSVPDYPMTPGDTLQVAYLSSMSSATVNGVVDARYRIDLGFFGAVDAEGKSYLEVKQEIAALVKRAYPNSYPSITLVSVGSYLVSIDGAVTRAGDVSVWRLVRMSEVVYDRIAEYGSERYITLRRADGTTREIDLFTVRRNGTLTDDPYLEPGDAISVGESVKRVTLAGEVARPGVYEVLPREDLGTIVDIYGGGTTSRADEKRLRITRPDAESERVFNLILDYTNSSVRGFVPLAWDTITFDSLIDRLPVIYVEGAVNTSTSASIPSEDPVDSTDDDDADTNAVAAPDASVTPPISGIERVPLYADDTLFSALSRARIDFDPRADLASAMLRPADGGEEIEIDLERLLFLRDLSADRSIEAGDRVLVPFGAIEVFVSGEVDAAGLFEIERFTRLSEFLDGRLTDYASNRDIELIRATGERERYDLFAAKRSGLTDQDPYLEPGDRIRVDHLDRLVTIRGEVERPESYQLLRGEELVSLIETYAGGATDLADRSRIEILRANTGSSTPYERIVVDLSASDDFELRNLDTVVVQNRLDLLPVVYLEGAIIPEAALDSESAPTTMADPNAEVATRMRVTLRSGDTLYTVLSRAASRIDERGDLSRAFIRRTAEPGSTVIEEIDMERLLYGKATGLDVDLSAGDRIIVPFGTMEVFVTGEVIRSEWITIEPLTRLSEVVGGRLTAYSSKRDISVISANDTMARYDLFLAERFGRKDQDPYLETGDTISVSRAERKVTIRGEVERGGTYELLEGETLESLVGYYGGGLTIDANPAAVEVIRSLTENGDVTQKRYINLEDSGSGSFFPLDGDVVTIPSKLVLLPYVFFEGAVLSTPSAAAEEDAIGTDLDTTSRFRYRFHSGELLSEALEQVENRFSAESDLANAYVMRADGSRLDVDMEALLRRSAAVENLELEPYDRFIVPFKQYFVIVAGAVRNPGRYPYIPDRNYRYYVDLAGGFDTTLHWRDAIEITDIDNNPVRTSAMIEPETKIYAPINNPLYYVNQLSGVLGVLGTVLSILAVTGVFGAGG